MQYFLFKNYSNPKHPEVKCKVVQVIEHHNDHFFLSEMTGDKDDTIKSLIKLQNHVKSKYANIKPTNEVLKKWFWYPDLRTNPISLSFNLQSQHTITSLNPLNISVLEDIHPIEYFSYLLSLCTYFRFNISLSYYLHQTSSLLTSFNNSKCYCKLIISLTKVSVFQIV